MGEISCQWKKQIPRFADSARDDNLGSVVMAWHYFGSGQKEIEGAGDEGLEVLARDNGVEETVFEEEFGALKSFGEFLADGLLDDARAGETDERAGFGDVEVAEHGEAGGDASGGGVGHHGDVGDLLVVEAGEAGGDLGELHQAGNAFHHARATRGRDDDERMPCGEGAVDCTRDGLADDGSHAAADEAVLHHAEDDRVRAELADGVDDGVVEAGLLLGVGEALLVGLEVGEVERVGGAEFEVDEFVAGLEQVLDAGARVDAEVMTALGADLEVGLKLGFEDDLEAAGATDPQALGANRLLRVVDDLVVFAFEPTHSACLPGTSPIV